MDLIAEYLSATHPPIHTPWMVKHSISCFHGIYGRTMQIAVHTPWMVKHSISCFHGIYGRTMQIAGPLYLHVYILLVKLHVSPIET